MTKLTTQTFNKYLADTDCTQEHENRKPIGESPQTRNSKTCPIKNIKKSTDPQKTAKNNGKIRNKARNKTRDSIKQYESSTTKKAKTNPKLFCQ